jgi:hypothetical protein
LIERAGAAVAAPRPTTKIDMTPAQKHLYFGRVPHSNEAVIAENVFEVYSLAGAPLNPDGS